MKTAKGKKRGIIAVSTLYISIILLILIIALLVSLKAESGHVLRYNYATEALYIGEAGMADAVRQLTANNKWKPGLADKVVFDFPNGKGRYTIVFDEDNKVGSEESVNNLEQDHAVDGPRGKQTVPARTADVVVNVEYRGHTLRYEALISRGFADPITVPLLTSGKITMEGEVAISGVESATDRTSVEVGIHSNDNSNQPDIISWKKLDPDDEALINGSVSTTSDNPGAISAPAGFTALDVTKGKAPMPFPIIDVDTAIHYGKLSPAITVNPGGNTVVNGGDHSFAGGVINGDLILNGGNLFVNGNLEVNGTIKGHGAIYVKNNTSFRGSSELHLDATKSLSLFSGGKVSLSGFDGTQFLEDIANNNPDFKLWYDQSKQAHDALVTATNGSFGTDWGAGNATVEQWRNALGGTGPTPEITPAVTDPAISDPADPGYIITPAVNYESDTLGKMITFLKTNYPTGESAMFLAEKLQATKDLYADGGPLQTVNDAASMPAGAANTIADLKNQDFDRLGNSLFDGVVYSNDSLYADHEVQIEGALLVKASYTKTGDVFLGGKTKIIYNKELLENPFVGTNTGPVVVVCWLGEVE